MVDVVSREAIILSPNEKLERIEKGKKMCMSIYSHIWREGIFIGHRYCSRCGALLPEAEWK